MGLVEEVGTYLDSNSTRFALGTNLYLNWMVDEPGTAASIIETAGPAPTFAFASTRPSWENIRFQVACRSTSSTKARANADAAFTIFSGIANQTLSGTTYLRVAPVQSVFLMERDERGRVVFGFNCEGMRRR